MSKLTKRVRAFGFVAMCLSLMLGVMGISGAATANASSNAVIMQTIYTDGNEATLVVKVSTSQYQSHGVTLVCTNGNSSTAKSYYVDALSGTTSFSDGNYATVEYSSEGCYVVTYKVQKSTIPAGARAYFTSGSESANNGGYNYYIFG